MSGLDDDNGLSALLEANKTISQNDGAKYLTRPPLNVSVYYLLSRLFIASLPKRKLHISQTVLR